MSPEHSAGAVTTAPSPVGRNSSMSNGQENHVINSLGDALAGVNIGGGSGAIQGNQAGFSFHSEGTPFSSAPAPDNQGDGSGWGFSPAADPNTHHSGTGSTPADDVRAIPQRDKESLDMFLSQSPSQMLGRDVFKLSTGNLPGLAMPQQEGANNADAFRQPIGQAPSPIGAPGPGFTPGGRTSSVSPSSGVTGTTTSSRSNSPYENVGGGRTIQAYSGGGMAPSHRNNSFVISNSSNNGSEDHGSVGYGMNHGHGSQPTISSLDNANNGQPVQSPYGSGSGSASNNGIPFNVGMSTYASTYDQPNSINVAQTNTSNQSSPSLQQQQVLYMAVPTPDGRGQVLQPVQMVQLPGKPYAYVLPNGGMPPPMQVQITDGQQPMVVLPTAIPPQQQQPPPMGDMSGMLNSNGRNPQRSNFYGGNTNQNSENPTALRSEEYGSANRVGESQYVPDKSGDSSKLNHPDSLSSLYTSQQRPSLDSLLGQVRRLSRDQVGCRLVQQALDDEGPMAAALILNEGLPFWGEAMVDPFGNYLFQKILEKATAEERIMLVKSVSARLVNASLNLHGTRSVQKIVELCSKDEGTTDKDGETAADVLTRSLTPAAARLCIDSHGNHVIQRILLKLGHRHCKFVFDAVAESVGDVARHRHGCCVIQRCLDSPPSEARSHLVMRIVDKSLELMQDAYGNYVVQYVLDVCADDDVHAVCESVIGKVNLLAIQKFSSNVMEKCLERCTDRVKVHYMAELSDTERVRELMMDPFGNYVVQRALSVATHSQAIRLVEAMKPHLLSSQPGTPTGQRNGGVRNTAGGRRIMAKITRRFPNFTLNPSGPRDDLYSQNKGHQRHQQQPQFPNPTMGNPYGQLNQGATLHQQYGNIPTVSNPMGSQPQFDQRQRYYDFGEAAYYSQQNGPHMGHGAYPSY